MVSYHISDEKIFRFMRETKGDEIEQVMKLLGRTAEEQCLASSYCAATYATTVYQVLGEELGPARRDQVFVAGSIFGRWCTKAAVKEMGLKDIKEVKDIPTMAKLFQKALNSFGELCIISASSDDRAVVDMIFCKAPMLGQTPCANYMDMVRYCSGPGKIGYANFCSDFPKMCGLGDEVEGKLTHAMCLGEGPTCRTVFERKR